jgi:hypothetical protein
MMEMPATMTYSGVVAQDSVWLAFLIAALNGININTCNIGNGYLHSPCKTRSGLKPKLSAANTQADESGVSFVLAQICWFMITVDVLTGHCHTTWLYCYRG